MAVLRSAQHRMLLFLSLVATPCVAAVADVAQSSPWLGSDLSAPDGEPLLPFEGLRLDGPSELFPSQGAPAPGNESGGLVPDDGLRLNFYGNPPGLREIDSREGSAAPGHTGDLQLPAPSGQ